MENKYQQGKIYKIVCNITNEIYYGSTKETLKERLRLHILCRNCMSINIIDRGDYKIELIKDYPCNSKKELEEEESKYIRENECINIIIPNRTKKEWTKENRKKINNQVKERYKIFQQEILEKAKERITCECGSILRKADIARHRRSKKHIKFLEEKSM